MRLLPEWLFPDERRFFARFIAVANRIHTAARLLEQAFDDPTWLPELLLEIERVNRLADVAAHELDVGADRMFIPPMDREDVHALSVRLIRVTDFIGGTARRAVSLRLTESREVAVALSRLLVKAAHEITHALTRIREADQVMRHCRAIKEAEEEGDAVWEGAVAELFQGNPDPLEVLRWKTVYDQLEETLDTCGDVANVLESLTVKRG